MKTETSKINAVVEVLRGNVTKTSIAAKYGFSLRSLGRYVERFKDEANEIIKKEDDMATKAAAKPESTVETSSSAIEFINKQMSTVNKIRKTQPQKPKQRATRASGKSIKGTVISILERYRDDGKTGREYREFAVSEIQNKTGLDRKHASKYYAGYKKAIFS